MLKESQDFSHWSDRLKGNSPVRVSFQALSTTLPTGLGVHCLPQPATLETSTTVNYFPAYSVTHALKQRKRRHPPCSGMITLMNSISKIKNNIGKVVEKNVAFFIFSHKIIFLTFCFKKSHTWLERREDEKKVSFLTELYRYAFLNR